MIEILNFIVKDEFFTITLTILALVFPIIWRRLDYNRINEKEKLEINRYNNLLQDFDEIKTSIKKIKKFFSPKTELDWFEDGIRAYDKRKYDRAIKCFLKSIKIKPNIYAYNSLGLYYKDKPNPDFDKAIEYFIESLKLCIENDCKAKIYFNLGFSYVGKGQLQKAIDCFNKVLVLLEDKNEEELKIVIMYALGVLHSDMKNPEEVIKFLTKFIKLSNDIEKIKHAYYVLGKAYWITEDFDKTQEYFQKVIELGVNDAEILYSIGYYYLAEQIEDNELAIECFLKALDLGYYSNVLYLYIGFAYHRIYHEKVERDHDLAVDAYNKAVECFKKITDIDESKIIINIAEVYSNMGLAYYTIDEYDKSLQYSQKAIDSGYANAFVYCNMGLAYERMGTYISGVFYDSALAYFKKAIELDKNYAKAYYCMGNIFLKKGLLYTEKTALGIKLIQHAGELGLFEAKEFLIKNKELILKVPEINTKQIDTFFLLL